MRIELTTPDLAASAKATAARRSLARRREVGATLRLLAAVLPLIAPLAGVPAPAQEPKGDLWETTSQMSMEGMPMQMPASTVKVCAAKEWKEVPGSSAKGRNCKTSNMKTVENKVTWDVQCTGPTMTGSGEITRTDADSYTGAIKFTSADGNMTIKLTGRKIGGCDNPQ